MKSMEITANMDSKRKLLTALFWTNRKGARTEGCAPFLIEKISTENETYTARKDKFLKINDEILNDILDNIENQKNVDFILKLGKETFNASLSHNTFSISAERSKELEEEIIEKLEMEMKKKYPNICDSFPPRVGIRK
ncbi:hypothetical protein [Methanobacterium oryzae]|uniref:hypothetical protein n=1 Tax=Methanobacterium oryzae TaxID=69540 RepID=UPI003D23AB2A